jgi:hypothetical protein
MRINKKVYTTFAIAILTLSIILATMPMVSAIAAPPGLFVPANPPVTPIASGPVGTKVCVVGVAGDASPFSTVTVYWDSLAGQVLGTAAATVTGTYAVNVTIPAAVTGAHYIVVNDGAGAQGTVFTVTASLRASSVPPGPPPVRVLPGDAVALTGRGFAAASAVTVTLTGPAGTLTIPGTFTTNSTGSFTATIIVPSIAPTDYGTYTVTATDAATTSATASIVVDYYIIVFPPAGPPGISISISGRIPATTAYDIRVDTTSIYTGTSAADGTFSTSYTIPALIALGGHTISVVWAVTNVRTAPFTVNPSPTLTYTPASGVAGAVVTISGAGFSGGANITLTMGTTVVNSTAADSRFGPTTMGGAFTNLKFTVPTLTPGVYVLTVTDQFGASTGTAYTFTVLATPVTTIALRGTTYYPGDIFSFNIYTTEASIGVINVTISDPSGRVWWLTDDWTLTDFGTYKIVMFQNQGADNYNQMRMMLPADAPLGTWNWTITYTPASTTVKTKASGLFTVAASTTDTIINKINELGANMTDLEASIIDVVTDSEGDLTAVINTKVGTITTKLDALGAQIQGIEDMGIIIATDVGEIKVAIEDLDLGTMGVDITAIKGDVATIKTNLGTVTTNVATLDAKVVALSGDVATVSTTLGTLEGTVTSIDGKVATIDTDVGTLQADVTEILDKPGVDMTPVWIAVVLSLIAAIAAIFAVVTIRQKIAG